MCVCVCARACVVVVSVGVLVCVCVCCVSRCISCVRGAGGRLGVQCVNIRFMEDRGVVVVL